MTEDRKQMPDRVLYLRFLASVFCRLTSSSEIQNPKPCLPSIALKAKEGTLNGVMSDADVASI